MICYNGISEYCSSVPVTVAKILDKIILTGEGSFLHIYEFCKENNKSSIISHHKIFQNTLIHGIKQNDENFFKVCIYGGRYLKNIIFTNWKLIASSTEKLLSDRILDVHFKNNNLIVLLANNSVLILDISHLQNLYQITTSDECSLFSGLIYFDDKFSEYIMMSGSFFNQVLIWSFDSSITSNQNPQHATNSQAVILHRLNQHKGVITSIFYHNTKNLILTSSDDRSIQLWRVNFIENNDDYLRKSDWSTANFNILLTLFGHSSRIWKAVITNDYLISAGEDACLVVWDHDGENIKKIKVHQGKNIWAMDINDDEDRMITGGGDGSIRIWNLKRKIKKINDNTMTIKTDLNSDNYPRQVLCLNFNLLLIVTMNGQFILHSILEKKCTNLFSDTHFASYCSVAANYIGNIIAIGNICGVLKIILLNDLKIQHSLHIEIFKGKIFSINFLLNGTVLLLTGPEGKLELFQLIISKECISIQKYANFVLPNCKQRWVTCADICNNLLICGDRHGNIFLYNLEVKDVNPIYCFDKIHGSNDVTFIRLYNGLVYSCGRNGILNIFEIESNKMILVQSYSIIKGFEWLTNIIFIKDEIFILGFFSNKFVAYSLNFGEFIFELECGGGHRAWDFKIAFINNQMEFRFACIKQKCVVVIDHQFVCYQMIVKNSFGGSELKAVQNISSENCCNILLTCGEDGYLNLTKITVNELFHLQICSLLSIKVVSSNLRTLSFISNSNISDRKLFKDGVIVCGGGGNIFKILSLKWKNTIPVDDSQPIESLNFPEKTYFNNFNSIPYNNKGVIYEPHIKSILVYDMNEKLARKKKLWKNLKEWEELPEARCMCIDTFSCIDKHIAICVATSMGIIRLFIFNETKKTCALIWNASFHSHCLTKVKHLYHTIYVEKELTTHCENINNLSTDHIDENFTSQKESNFIKSDDVNYQEFIFTAGTDGKIAIWNVTNIILNHIKSNNYGRFNSHYIDRTKLISSSEKKYCLNLENKSNIVDAGDPYMLLSGHQSGINALDFINLSGNKYILVTGGDDNLIHLFLIDIIEKNIIAEYKHEFAHAAQITGIKFLDKKFFVSVSIDQRLIVWEIDNFDNLNIFQLFGTVTDVSDVSDISSSKLNSDDDTRKYVVTVVGAGTQTFKISLPSNFK